METKGISSLTVATYITLLRLICVPLILISMLDHMWGLAILFFLLASITDMIDGMVARARNEVSWLGTILDPLVDKLMLITIYTGLMYSSSVSMSIPRWFLVLVILHELAVMLGAAYWSLFKQEITISPSRLAKVLGFGQFLFIAWLLLSEFTGTVSPMLFYQLLVLVACARTCLFIQYGLLAYYRRVS